MQQLTKTEMKNRLYLLILPFIFLGCGLTPKEIDYNDPELQPLLEALKEVKRDSLGFTEIDKNDQISIEDKSSLFKKPYDKMLHIYGKTSRTIAFKKINSVKYKWIGEQEIFTGPRKFETADGEQNEQIVLNYDKIRMSGAPTNVLYISYYGPNKILSQNPDLKFTDIQPFIEKWTH